MQERDEEAMQLLEWESIMPQKKEFKRAILFIFACSYLLSLEISTLVTSEDSPGSRTTVFKTSFFVVPPICIVAFGFRSVTDADYFSVLFRVSQKFFIGFLFFF